MIVIFRLLTLLFILLTSSAALAESRPLRMGITPATARNQYALFEEWRLYLQQKLDKPVEFILCDSFHDSVNLMKQKKLDIAWVSSPAYIENKQHMKLLVSPVYQGKTFDRAYLIVPSTDLNTQDLQDLKGRVFAFVEPDSNTGYLTTRFQLKQTGQEPDQFFKKSFFTHDHLKVIAAVAIGLADGGSLSGFTWETLALTRPDITGKTRIVAKSAGYSFPPVVARSTLDSRDFLLIQRTLLTMSDDPQGAELLKRLNLDKFIIADRKIYRDAEVMMKRMGNL